MSMKNKYQYLILKQLFYSKINFNYVSNYNNI